MFLWIFSLILIVSSCYGQRYYHNYPRYQRYYFVYPTIDYPKYQRLKFSDPNQNDYHNQYHPMYLAERERVHQRKNYYPVANYRKGQHYKQPPHYLDYDSDDYNHSNNQHHNQPIVPHVRFFGQPAPYAHTHDNFDRETTIDELQSRKINPIPHAFNPALRSSLVQLQQNEANYHKL